GMCDPSNPSTGIVKVELPSGASPQFPITYTLYKVVGGVRTVVMKAGVPVKKTITTRPANMEDANALFSDIEKLGAGEGYEVKFESGCFDKWIPVPDFGSLASPTVRSSSATQCAGRSLTLSVDLPASLYDIEWKSAPASALSGVSSADKARSSITFNVGEDAEYWVTYSMKSGFGCTPSQKDTAKKRVNLTRSNFTDGDISALSDIQVSLPLNSCTANASWTAPVITDTSGCGYKLTWEVTKPDGSKYTPPTDADGNSQGTSWNGFPVGESTVTYKVEGKISGGTVGTKRFKVTVTAPNINLQVNSSFVSSVGSSTSLTSVTKGTTVYYKVTIKNMTTQAITGGALRVTLPSASNGNYELPLATDPNINKTELGSSVNVTYDTDPRVMILANIDGSVLTQNAERSAYIPIKIKRDRPCSEYENACSGVLSGKAEFRYQIGSACPMSGSVSGSSVAVGIDNSDCVRQELLCQGGNVHLSARGSGYTGYAWFSGGSDGTSYTAIPGTGQSQTVTTAGYYKVEKTAVCDGATVKVSEIIQVIASNDNTPGGDPIRNLSGGAGGVCSTTSDWVSHFYLCDGSTRQLQVGFYQAQDVLWQQEASGCAPASANCVNKGDSCWTTVQSGRSFTLSTAGRYRLRVREAGCTRDYYFEVFTAGLEGTVTNKVDHTDLSQGAATVEMNTHHVQYKYTVVRLSDNQVLYNNVLGPSLTSPTPHILNITGLVVPGTRTYDEFKITITSSPESTLNGCKWEQTIRINYSRQMKATVTFTNLWKEDQCNKARYDFSITGGQRDYKILVYKIDGALAKPSYVGVLMENIPDSEYSTHTPSNALGTAPDVFQAWLEVPREGRYIFLVKDSAGRFAETNEVIVGQTSKYGVQVSTEGNPLLCATANGATIKARFLDTTVPSPQIKLSKYKSDGTIDTSFPVQTNASGIFPNLGAGKYRVDLSYLMSGVTGARCHTIREVEISSPDPIEASVGVVKDISCSTDTPKQFELRVNWVKGGVPPYTYSTGGAYTSDTTLKVSGGSSANPKVKVYIKDKNGCIKEVEVMAKKDLEEPTVQLPINVTYDCAGNGTFTITPQAPAGHTYEYEYSLDGGVRQLPNGAGGAMTFSGLAGKASPYQVGIYYREPSTTSVNELYKETFGDLDTAGCSDGAPAILGCANATGELSAGSYVVTKQLPTSTDYISVAGTGRYYAARTAVSGSLSLYEKEIHNVVPRRGVSVSFKYINLGQTNATQANVDLNVILEVANPMGGGFTRFTKNVPSLARGAGWGTATIAFDELEGFNQNANKVKLIIEARRANTAVGLDDIRVFQPTENCQTAKIIPVQVVPNRGFSAMVVSTVPPDCQGGEGTIHVNLRNVDAGASYTYRLSVSGMNHSITLVGGDRLEIPAPVGTHRVFVTMTRTDGTSCEVEAGNATITDVPQLVIRELTIQPKGCAAPYLTAGATVKVSYGTAPYKVLYKEVGGSWQSTPATNDATISFDGLSDNRAYVFQVEDAKGCKSAEISRFIPAKIDLAVDIQETLCFPRGGTASINIQVTSGNGGYEFSKDNGTTWVSDPSNPTQYEFDGLSPGTYLIKVRDQLGCEQSKSVTIGATLEVDHTSDNGYDCSSAPQETIEILVRGGVAPYSLQWKRGGNAGDLLGYNPSTDNDGGNVNITGPVPSGSDQKYTVVIKTAGTYHFRITDSKIICVQTTTEVVEAVLPAFLSSANLSASEIGCAGESTGIIGVPDGSGGYLSIEHAIDRTKGVAPYTITIFHSDSGGTTGSPVGSNTGRNLAAGWYKVRLTDSKGCYVEKLLEVKEIARPNLTATKEGDISCDTSGNRQLGKIRMGFTTAPMGNYFIGLYRDNTYTALAVNEKPTPENTGKTLTGVTSANELFDYLPEGDYYPAVVNLATGCFTKLAKITITGTNLSVSVGSVTNVTCDKVTVELKVKDTQGTIDETKLKVAFYRGTTPSSSDWFTSTTTTGTGNNKEVIFTKEILPKVPYKIATNYNGCISIHDLPAADNTGAATITQKRIPALCGGSVHLHYEATGMQSSVTSVDWAVYEYPMDPRVPTPPGVTAKASGTAAVTSGTATITTTTASLQAHRQYILVLRNSVGTPKCVLGSKVFSVSESPSPLALVSATVTKNSSCNASAEVTVTVKDGTGPYRYTISQVSTEPTLSEWSHANVIATATRSVIIDKTFVATYAGKIEGTLTGSVWYVHVRDAQDCVVTQQVTVFKDDTAHITGVEVDNPCVVGNEYTVKVTLDKIGSGQHYYTFKPVGGVESARQPIQFTQVSTSPARWEGYIYRVYADATAREVRIYDQNGCVSNIFSPFEFKGKVTFTVTQSKPITCQSPGDGEITVSHIENFLTGKTYGYRLVREERHPVYDPLTGELIGETTTDVIVKPNTLLSSSADFTIGVSTAGRYRVDIYEQSRPDCAYSRSLTIRDKVTPVMQLQSTDNSKCYNAAQTLGASEGGQATLLTSPESEAPMSYTLVGARYADDGTPVTLTIPSTYQNVSTTNTHVEVTNNGRKVTFKKLLGDVRGIVYTVKAKAKNGCEATTEFTIYGVKPILIDINRAQVVQFACSGDQELPAKLSLPLGAITGGSGTYRFTLLKGGVPVPRNENLTEPSFTITDETGGSYRLRVVDAVYSCDPVEIDFTVPSPVPSGLPTPTPATPANRDIRPFIKITNVASVEQQDITCNAGESIDVTVTLSPATTTAKDISVTLRSLAGGFNQTQTIQVTGSSGVAHFVNVPMGNYSVTAMNPETGCITYGQAYRVQDPNTFSITATNDKPVKCYGGSDGEITLTFTDLDMDNGDQASAGFSYTITSITNPSMAPITGTVTGATTTTLNNLPYGTYNVEAKSLSTGCVTKIPSIFNIRQADQPINITAKAEVPDNCSGTGSGEISLVITGGIAPYKITITGDNGHTQTATGVYNRWVFIGLPGGNAPGVTAHYTFTVEDAWGCTTATVTPSQVDIKRPMPIDFTPVADTQVSCLTMEDATIEVLGVTGGSPDDPNNPGVTTYYYELVHSTRGSIRPLQTSNKFTDLPAGHYTLRVMDRWGCYKEQQFDIKDPVPIAVSFVGTTSLLCYDTTGSVEVTATGGTHPSGTPTYTFELIDQATGTVVKTEENISVLPHRITGLKPNVVYAVRAIDGVKCTGTSTTIVLSTAPNLNVKATYEDDCTDNHYEGNIVITFDEATVDYSKVRYSFDGGATKHAFTMFSGAQARIDRNHASVRPSSLPQVISLYYTDGGTSCQGETNPVVIPVVEDLLLIKDPSYTPEINELKVLGKNGVPEYTYYFNGVYYGNKSLYVVSKGDPEGIDPMDGKLKKKIEVKVQDSKGCTAEATFYMEYIDIEIPRFFTPNGDGDNDTWAPRNTQHYPHIHTLIFDRYGRLLKELGQRESWDGVYHGKPMPTGDYWYIMTLGEEGEDREYKGHFTLFR
ncbi:HYR domain protein, partial [Capnocytophaga sp. oral taxon 338 str. F0234]